LQPPEDFHAKYWALLVFAVLVAFGPLVLTNQSFWDDWVLIAHSSAGTLWELFKQAGRREQFFLVKPFAAAGDARACTVMVLLLCCVLAPLIYTVIRRATRWPAVDAFWAALLTALVPLNQARFVLATEPYAFSCVFFALALVFLLRDLARPSLGLRILTALLLVMAFSTNSFLVLAWIAPAIVAADAWRNTPLLFSFAQRAGATIRALASRGELILLPPIYWLAKQTLEPTYGLYANYNKFHVGVLPALTLTIKTFFHQFDAGAGVLIPRLSDLPELIIAAAIVIALFIALARFWQLPLKTVNGRPAHQAMAWRGGLTLILVVALIVSALFPYVMVGQPPRFGGLWETRHQTTLMLVSGFAIFSLLQLVVPRPILWRVAAAMAALFLVIDIAVTHQLVVDALETRAVTELFKQHPSPPGTMMFVLENDRDYRALGRFFPFYELSALANADATGKPRMAMSNLEVLDPSTGTYPQKLVPTATAALIKLCQQNRLNPQFGFGGFVSNGQIETVRLVTNRKPPGVLGAIREAIRANGTAGPDDKLPAMVRAESEITPIGGACVSPCCSDR
jgi:hypothetical protein